MIEDPKGMIKVLRSARRNPLCCDAADCMEYQSAIIERLERELAEALKALWDANGLCRSAYQIAERTANEHGDDFIGTHWGHFRDQLYASLKYQHTIMFPEMYPDAAMKGASHE